MELKATTPLGKEECRSILPSPSTVIDHDVVDNLQPWWHGHVLSYTCSLKGKVKVLNTAAWLKPTWGLVKDRTGELRTISRLCFAVRQERA